jgi:replicative DNA helicase
MHYAKIIREKSVLRGLLQAADDIAHCVRAQDGTAAELLDRAEQSIFSLKKWEKGDAMEHVAVVMHRVFVQLEILAQYDSEFSGMSTGMHSLDLAINGLNNSDLLIVAARPGMGKTAFLIPFC